MDRGQGQGGEQRGHDGSILTGPQKSQEGLGLSSAKRQMWALEQSLEGPEPGEEARRGGSRWPQGAGDLARGGSRGAGLQASPREPQAKGRPRP